MATATPALNPKAEPAVFISAEHKYTNIPLLPSLLVALIGGSLPSIRGRAAQAGPGEKTSTAFYFQVIHPDAVSGNAFAKGRSQMENLKEVIGDIFGHGNEKCILPGQFEAEARKRSDEAGGLHFTQAELDEFAELAAEVGAEPLKAI